MAAQIGRLVHPEMGLMSLDRGDLVAACAWWRIGWVAPTPRVVVGAYVPPDVEVAFLVRSVRTARTELVSLEASPRAAAAQVAPFRMAQNQIVDVDFLNKTDRAAALMIAWWYLPISFESDATDVARRIRDAFGESS